MERGYYELKNSIENNQKNKQLTKALEELDLTQKHLIQQEKLASIGQLVAGVAHEINNPLGYISSNFETAKLYFNEFKEMLSAYRNFIQIIPKLSSSDIEAGIQELKIMENKKEISYISDDFEKLTNDIEEGLRRITDIITSLNAYSRIDKNSEFEEFDFNKSIQNTLLITYNNIKYHAKVEKNLASIPNLQACRNKIEQVLLNIILNSSQAIKEKQVKEEHIKESGLIIITTDVKDCFVRCTIEDNGIGIDDEDMSKIFDPFYTTKPIGKGTGLGLSIAYDIIVNQHKGQLLVESTPMVGTKFILLLPINQSRIEQVTINE